MACDTMGKGITLLILLAMTPRQIDAQRSRPKTPRLFTLQWTPCGRAPKFGKTLSG